MELSYDDTQLHLGTVENLEVVHEKGVYRLHLVSRSLTAMLLQNQLEPGLHATVSLDKLMTEFYTLPEEITWEASEDTSNYLYVKSNSSMWDGVVSLTYKIYASYPFVRGANEICMNPPDTYQTFTASDAAELLKVGTVTDQSLLCSDYYMADADGTYGAFHESDTEVSSHGLVRTKQLALDLQYIYNPQQALTFRRKFADRRLIRYYVEILGASTLSLGDRITYGSILNGALITRVCITGNGNGIRTRLEAYEDPFHPSTTSGE
ncbi:MAG: hypothetical protein LUC50_04505 [Ruminococcus sp.]|nr:hypothetical protein [Ruminococcus sp.]